MSEDRRDATQGPGSGRDPEAGQGPGTGQDPGATGDAGHARGPEGGAGDGPAGAADGGDGEGGGEEARNGEEGGRDRGRGWSGPISDIQEVVSDLVDTALRGFSSAGGRGPRLDLVQVPGEGYRVLIDLPGVEKEDLEVSTVADELVVAGDRKRPVLPSGSEVVRSERGYGRFRRTLRLPAGVDPGAVRAKLEDGVLQLTLPLLTESAKHSVEVE